MRSCEDCGEGLEPEDERWCASCLSDREIEEKFSPKIKCAYCEKTVLEGEGFKLNPRLVQTELDFSAFPKMVHETIRHHHDIIIFCDTCMEAE